MRKPLRTSNHVTVASRGARRRHDLSQLLYQTGWYHSFELPDGTAIEGVNKLETLRERFERFPIPANLRGKRVLDIGAWDGWFSFEAERRGASVVAVDCVEIPNFLEMHRRLNSRVDYRVVDFYDLPSAGLGRFDYVFFTGVLYHLKHPLLALEIVCALATDTVIVESFVTDGDDWQDHADDMPVMEFYETDELGGHFDNWIGPTVGCLTAMCRAAGFARVELLRATGANAMVACYRRWDTAPDASADPPELLGVMNTRTLGINFSSRAEEYVSCWFRTPRETLRREDLRLEMGGYGAPGLFARHEPDGTWLGNFRLPPGLPPGWTEVRVALAESPFSDPLRVAVDVPTVAKELVLEGVTDGITWERNAVSTLNGPAFLSCWVRGLPDNCDRANIRVSLGGTRLPVVWVGPGDGDAARQFNVQVSYGTRKGAQRFRIECGGSVIESEVTVR
jgi:tRNA (mo5U34)-methyltransferase